MKCMAGIAGASVALIMAAGASAQGYGYDDRNAYGYNDARYEAPRTYTNTRCKQARDDNQLAGALVGGLIGAVAGGLIVDNNSSGHGSRHYRGGRGYGHGYNGYGYSGYRGRGHHGSGHHDNDGEVIAGALLGAVVGGLAGSELAKSSVNCDTEWRYSDVPPPTRSAAGPGWNSAPAHRVSAPQPDIYEEPLRGAPDDRAAIRDCQEVMRETRMPDGRIVREPVLACRNGEIIDEPRTRYGGWELED